MCAPGTAVDLVVSTGVAPVAVPNVVGLSAGGGDEAAIVAANLDGGRR
jgi:beta-lactam-binding protein with PASTA domain